METGRGKQQVVAFFSWPFPQDAMYKHRTYGDYVETRSVSFDILLCWHRRGLSYSLNIFPSIANRTNIRVPFSAREDPHSAVKLR